MWLEFGYIIVLMIFIGGAGICIDYEKYGIATILILWSMVTMICLAVKLNHTP